MGLKCLFGFHDYNDCTCKVCKKTRPDHHRWDGCKCTVCGQVRPHIWKEGQDTCVLCGDGIIPISTLEELQAINKDPMGHYRLLNDIDASATKEWDGGKGFVPIRDFSGVLDGNDHVIRNLYINRHGNTDYCYFGLIEENRGVIKHLHLESANIMGRCRVGSIVGSNQNVVSLSSSSGRIFGFFDVGGLAGHNTGKIEECIATCEVMPLDHNTAINFHSFCQTLSDSDKDSYGSHFGGLVGSNEGTVNRCWTRGEVTGRSFVGGLIGSNSSDPDEKHFGRINECAAFGGVSGKKCIGGLVGSCDGAIRNCFAWSSVSGTDGCGGLVGFLEEGSIRSSFAVGSICGLEMIGDRARIKDCYNLLSTCPPSDNSARHDIRNDTSAEAMQRRETFAGWDFENVWQIDEGRGFPQLRNLPDLTD